MVGLEKKGMFYSEGRCWSPAAGANGKLFSENWSAFHLGKCEGHTSHRQGKMKRRPTPWCAFHADMAAVQANDFGREV